MNTKPITPAEASAALGDVEQAGNRMKAIIAARSSRLLLLWGIIWCVGFCCTQFRPEIAGRTWIVLDVIGVLASLALGPWAPCSAIKDPVSRRIGVSWLVFLVYGIVWVALLDPRVGSRVLGHPLSYGFRICAFCVIACMFGYTVMGVWLRSRILLWTGIGVSAATVLGLVLLPAYFFLLLAIGGGGALVVAGLIMRKVRC
jgi:hypothetical protein